MQHYLRNNVIACEDEKRNFTLLSFDINMKLPAVILAETENIWFYPKISTPAHLKLTLDE